MDNLLKKLKANIEERNILWVGISEKLIGEKFTITRDYFSNIYSSTGTNYKGRTCKVTYIRIDSYGDISCSVMIMNYKTNKHSIRYCSTISYEDLEKCR